MKKLLLIFITLFSLNTFSQGTDFDYDGTGNITDVTNWVDQFDGVTNPTDFTTGTFYITTSVSLDADWDMQGTAIVNDGATFTIGGALSINSAGLLTNSGTTGNIVINSTNASAATLDDPMANTVTYGAGSTVFPTTYNILTISGNSTLGSGTTIVNTTLNLGAAVALTLNGQTLQLKRVVSGTGTITGDALANLSCTGTSANTGSLNFTSGARLLNNFTISKATTRSVTLGTDLTVGGAFSITTASLILNGKQLTLNGSITVTTSSVVGSSTASLVIGGSGTTTNNLIAHPTFTNISAFTLNRSGATFTLQRDMTLGGGLTLSNGSLDLNGKLLTLNGDISSTSGNLVGSATSTLSIAGSGSISGTLNGLTDLSDFTLNRSGQILTIGSNLTIAGVTNLTAGVLNLNSRLLTLNGVTTFGASTISGSTTSSLSIGGSGSISGSMLMTQTSSSTRSLYDLTLNRSSQTLTIGNALEINNSITPTLGTIGLGTALVTLKSTSSKKARVGVVGGGFTGTMNVETYIPGGTAGWNTLGPAGVSGLTVANWDGGSGSSTGIAMSCSGCLNNSGFYSIQADAAGNGTYTALTGSSNLTPGTGYWVYVAANLSSAIDITQTTTGPVVTGSQPSGTGFMSNPYASPISLSSLQGSNPGLGAIDVYDANGGAYTSYNGGIPSDVIPMGQGFYSNGVTSVTFNESNKTSSDNSMLRTATNIGNVLKLKISDWYNNYDQTYIRLHDDATIGFDNTLDAHKKYATPGYSGTGPVYSAYTTISSLIGTEDYAINSLQPATTQDIVLPILVKMMATGPCTISPEGIENLDPNACVTLKDKLLNINHNLRSGAYVCTASDTATHARFELTICGNSLVTGIKSTNVSTNNVLIGQDGSAGIFVKTSFDKNTKSTISAYNVMGQQLIADKEIEGTNDTVYLDLKNTTNQIVIIKVTNEKGTFTQKVFLN